MTDTQHPSFNLVRDPWIPVVDLHGQRQDLSLQQAIVQAPQIRAVDGEMPQQTLPMLRLMLAVIYRAYGAWFPGMDIRPHEDLLTFWASVHEYGTFDDEVIGGYLHQWEDRFDLFDPERPFYQCPNLIYTGEKDHDDIDELVLDIPKPDKFLFSTRPKGRLGSLDPAQAARWLLCLQAYDGAGIKSPVGSPDPNVPDQEGQDGRVYSISGLTATGWLGAIGGTFLEGATLFETLMLNWCLFNPSGSVTWAGVPQDMPVWERDVATPPLTQYHPAGVVDLYTLQSRRVRLVHDDQGQVTGVIKGYGDLVSADDPDRLEPMTAVRRMSEETRKSRDLAVAPYVPRLLDAGRVMWRELQPLLGVAVPETGPAVDTRPVVIRWVQTLCDHHILDPQGTPIGIHVQSLIYDKYKTVVRDAVDDALPVGRRLFDAQDDMVGVFLDLVSRTDQGVRRLAGLVLQCQGGSAMDITRASKDTAIKAVVDQVRTHAYDELDGFIRTTIAEVKDDDDPEAVRRRWCHQVRAILERLGEAYMTSEHVSAFTPISKDGAMGGQVMARYRQQLAKTFGYHGPQSADRKEDAQ